MLEIAENEPTSPFGWDLINDLSAVPENEDIIIDYLLERLERGKIYTWVGPLLLVLNPFNEVRTSNTYDPTELEKYTEISSGARDEVDPHIYAVASKAHYSLIHEHVENGQVIVISGETGTGKTYNACKCLEFLSAVNRDSLSLGQGDQAGGIMHRLTDACRLISAFSTACTERNEVSSRHGQLVRLHYKADTIAGATINSLLLERSRVTKGSSNFQIFYQMMFGMSDEELGNLYLSRAECYDILSTVDPTKRKYFEESFQDTLKAIDVLGFDECQKRHIFQSLALLVHMGNIRFVENGETCTIDLDSAKSCEALKNTCRLSCLNQEEVVELVTTILINPQSTWRKHTSYHRNLITIDACRNRLYSIIRHVYDLLFHWILNRANDAVSASHPCPEWLGILDIFGFESFDVNGIEQLCVNYANEKMQKYFIETYLESGRKDLQEEGFISTKQPLDTIHLYRERLTVLEEALFLTLNDVSQSPVAVDISTIIQLACGNLQNRGRRFLDEKDGSFVINHYSGPVAYSIKDILSKNTDKVPAELSISFCTSKNKFLHALLNTGKEDQFGGIAACAKKRTMLAKLKYSMDMLIKELRKCNLYYVRCVKPSRLNENKWDRKSLRKQLANTGIFDALPLAKCKYPIRMSYEDFSKRYCKKRTDASLAYEKCRGILESISSMKELSTTVHYGKRLVFLTESVFLRLESCRRSYRNRCARRIQSFWQEYRQRKIDSLSKYENSMAENECLDENKSIRVPNDGEPKKSSSSEEDDVFTTSDETQEISFSVSQQRESKHGQSYMLNISDSNQNNILIKEAESLDMNKNDKNGQDHVVEQNKESCNDLEDSRVTDKFFEVVQNSVRNARFEDVCIRSCLKEIVNRKTSRFPFNGVRGKACKEDVDINSNRVQGNKCSETGLNNVWSKRKTYVVNYDKERGLYSIELEAYTLFYKNRILSRRRLAAVPIKLHMRSTCLPYSHTLPRSELPQGLQDCLE